jgi:hypothetical protein
MFQNCFRKKNKMSVGLGMYRLVKRENVPCRITNPPVSTQKRAFAVHTGGCFRHICFRIASELYGI